MHIIYLHGFASSPNSKKATFFREPLEAKGANYHIPDLNVPSFEKLTLTDILAKVADTINNLKDEQPIALIGSSLGGLTAIHFLDRYPDVAARVKKLVLLAPAFDFRENRNRTMGETWYEDWRAAGEMPFFNYAVNAERPVHFGFVEDVLGYESWGVKIDLPILIYHGKQDDTVDYRQSERFATGRENVSLHLLESDHQLLDKTDEILEGIINFLAL